MAQRKFLARVGTKVTELVALVQSTGVSDAFKILSTNSAGKLDESVLPEGVGADTLVLPSSENFAAGDYVSPFDDGGTMKFRLADKSTESKIARYRVQEAVTAPANATGYKGGTNAHLTGLEEGTEYVLGSAGAIIRRADFPADPASGTVVQYIGTAVSETELAEDLEANPMVIG